MVPFPSVLRLISRKVPAGYSNCISRKANFLGGFCSPISTVSVSDESVHCPSSLPSKISPWLMLPPALEGGGMVYKFYSLAEDKVLSLRSDAAAAAEWTPIGVPSSNLHNRDYQSFVYSTAHKLFYFITRHGELEAWDLRDPFFPTLIPMGDLSDGVDYYIMARSEEELKLKQSSHIVKFLVVNQKSGELFLVKRYCIERMNAEGFDVYRYDSESSVFRYMDGDSLDGLALFIGRNHGFAISADEFPELKRDSIYLSDVLGVKAAWIECPYGGHDNGIFSYGDGTISPCYFPCDFGSIKRYQSQCGSLQARSL